MTIDCNFHIINFLDLCYIFPSPAFVTSFTLGTRKETIPGSGTCSDLEGKFVKANKISIIDMRHSIGACYPSLKS